MKPALLSLLGLANTVFIRVINMVALHYRTQYTGYLYGFGQPYSLLMGLQVTSKTPGDPSRSTAGSAGGVPRSQCTVGQKQVDPFMDVKLGQLLGTGSFGRVYRGEHKALLVVCIEVGSSTFGCVYRGGLKPLLVVCIGASSSHLWKGSATVMQQQEFLSLPMSLLSP